MIVAQAALLLTVLASAPNPDSAATARRISASAELAAQEYRIGIAHGRVTVAEEVEEARLFLSEARRTATLLPARVADAVVAQLDSALALVAATGSPDSLDARIRRLNSELATSLQITLVIIPDQTPSLSRGATLYQAQCASCHGAAGRGNGEAGRNLTPPPADLTNQLALAGSTPLSFYQRITIGVAGTAMPAYDGRVSAADRWALALYATTLRDRAATGDVPARLRSFPTTAVLTDSAILAALGPAATRANLAAVRTYQGAGDDAAARTAIFTAVRHQVAEASHLARVGQNAAAVTAVFDAYLAFEQVERAIRVKDAALAADLETSFATLRTRVGGGATVAEIDGVTASIYAGLERAERVVADHTSPFNLFLQSLVILLREGLEAILIVGALMAFVVKVGAGDRKRDIHIGVAAAVALSLLTALLLETVFELSPAHQESLEAITMLVAVGVLFYVSYWLLSKMEVRKWTAFVKERVQVAVTGGSAFALAFTAFLAVYREGFETVLFYKALLVSGGASGATVVPVLAGIAVGGVALAVVYLLINRYGIRLPLRPFFGVTSAFLYYTAFVFAGKGIADLQEGGLIGTTVLPGWPRAPSLGVYPTVESLLAQGILLVLALVAVVWIFVIARRISPAVAPATRR